MSITEKIKQEAVWMYDNSLKGKGMMAIPLDVVLKILKDGLFIPYNITERDAFMAVLKSAAAHKNLVVVEKQKFQAFLAFLYSQAPLFCTHGKQELDCMKSTSPCKRKHRKECQVYLRIEKVLELFGVESVKDTKKETSK